MLLNERHFGANVIRTERRWTKRRATKKVVSCYFALVVPADKLSSKVDILKCTKNIFNETVLSFWIKSFALMSLRCNCCCCCGRRRRCCCCCGRRCCGHPRLSNFRICFKPKFLLSLLDQGPKRWSKSIRQYLFFKKNGPSPASFSVLFGLFKQTIQFLQQINVKNVQISIQHMLPGFKPTTYQTWVVTHNL